MKFLKTPVEAAKAVNLDARHPHKITVHWLFFPVQGKRYGEYLKAKEHVETQVRWLGVMSTDELFRVVEAIQVQEVPDIFSAIVREMYNVKKTGAHVVDISIGDGESKFPLFEYEDKASFLNPGIPQRAQLHEKPGSILVRKEKKPTLPMTQIPEATMRMIQNMKAKKK